MNIPHDEVWKLLYPRVTDTLLKGYCNGLLNPEKDKFFAATYVTDFPAADDLDFLKSKFDGSYMIKGIPPENPGTGGWQLAAPGTGLQPASCKAYSVSFQGAYYEGEWCLISSLTFFETTDEALAKNSVFPSDPFNSSIYYPYQESSSSYRSVDMQEFAAAPYLAAIVKQGKKEKINWAFRHYLEIALLQPLAEKLRIHYPDKYNSMVGMYGTEHFSSIFPVHKRFVLLVTGAKGLAENDSTNRYLLYIQENGNIYEWEYFPPGLTSFNYGESVTDQLKTVTYWDRSSYLHSSCTLDDDHFWEQYVFRQENGVYKYLRELTFNGRSLSLKI
ncbi:hypothetical protein [Chitinophaga arvensicola]|uniref:Uncharacterized protein n=1 Tax=Chitinophaga arvensicola TaxID=29529 RepID=A0A1I0R9G4_9BACT|nr:hypothetical protein [Chitinophaga arvensicola]SEW37236.1 hypothetical protein SAMN04488122_2486 [Chitinophaga arvensicola]